jgi:hypothetical protein
MFVNKYKNFFLGLAALSFIGGSYLYSYNENKEKIYKESVVIDGIDFFENKELIKKLKSSGKIKVRIGYNKDLLDKLGVFSDELVRLSVSDAYSNDSDVPEVDEGLDFSGLDFRKFKKLKKLKFTRCSNDLVSVKFLLDKVGDSVEYLCFINTYPDSGFDFTGADFGRLKKLKSIIIEGCSRFSAKSLNSVSDSLEYLDVQDRAYGIRDLSRFKNLKSLYVDGADFTVGMRNSISSELEHLCISEKFDPEAGDFSRFKKLKSLSTINYYDEFTPKMLDTVPSGVEVLSLSGLDPELSDFSRFENLRGVFLLFKDSVLFAEFKEELRTGLVGHAGMCILGVLNEWCKEPHTNEALEKVKSTINIKLKKDACPVLLPHVQIKRSIYMLGKVWLTNIDE